MFVKRKTCIYIPSLPVTDDELTLATPNGHQAVDGLDARLHGLPDGDARDDARGLQPHAPTNTGAQGALGRGGREGARRRSREKIHCLITKNLNFNDFKSSCNAGCIWKFKTISSLSKFRYSDI